MDKKALDQVKAEMGYRDERHNCAVCAHVHVFTAEDPSDNTYECIRNAFRFRVRGGSTCDNHKPRDSAR